MRVGPYDGGIDDRGGPVDDSAVSAVETAQLAQRGWVPSTVEGMWEHPHRGVGPVRLDRALEIEAGRSRLGEKPSSQAPRGTVRRERPRARQRRKGPAARLTWLEEQLEVRDEVITAYVPRWNPDDSPIPAEEAFVTAFDGLVADNTREAAAAALAGNQAKEAYRTGVEAGALGAVLALGLFASAVALGYAVWEKLLA
jgi:hypothetical protein